jgi:tRNA threonylcarbamoyladenosine biosynthesis protein TsaE
MKQIQVSHSEEDTQRIARELAQSLRTPAVILLHGDLGSGKTLFTKGLAAGLAMANPEDVTSPTFTLINEYRGRVRIYHIDLYRIETGALDGLGLDEILDEPGAVVVIEWAERLGAFETPGAIEVFLSWVDDQSRRIEICFSH